MSDKITRLKSRYRAIQIQKKWNKEKTGMGFITNSVHVFTVTYVS